MRKKSIKMIISILLIMIICIMINPLTSYSANIPNIEKDLKNIEEVTKFNDESKYDIVKVSEKLDNEEEFKEWANAMADIFEIALPNHGVIEVNGKRGFEIASALSDDECEQAYIALNHMIQDLRTLANIMEENDEELQMYFMGLNVGEKVENVEDFLNEKGFNWLTQFLGNFKGPLLETYNLNPKELKNMFIYRKILLDKFGKEHIGDLLSRAASARLTYKAAKAVHGIDNDTGVNFKDSEVTKRSYNKDKIDKYYKYYGYNYNGDMEKVIPQWCNTLKNALGKDEFTEKDLQNYAINIITEKAESSIGGTTADELNIADEEQLGEVLDQRVDPDRDVIFQQPNRTNDVAEVEGVDQVVSDANEFLKEGTVEDFLVVDELQKFSQNIYSLLLGIGVVVAVIIGMIIGIKLMIAPVGEKADAKKLLVPYIVGCVIIFGGFGIWQIAISIVQSI